ncbi:hypothetical protein [Streptomyces liliiviolaceus]|uniref:hypothetical protein n=1 Tax=Streptomyces liliiviolaceus TaxID=2823109 RepID=UPI001FFD0BC4|nr:hypothetical protein [Streptomyces liliiviolaceus]
MSGAALSRDPRLLASVRDVGTRPGIDFDYTDDAATAALLERHRRTVAAAEHGPLMWLGALLLVAAVVWPFAGSAMPAFDGRPELAYGPAGPLLVTAVACLTYVRRRWKRELLHPRLTGYRHVLGLARAHGVPVTHVPHWLVGRPLSGNRETVPVPVYGEVATLPTESASAQPVERVTPPVAVPDTPPVPAAVPAKPAAVAAYEAMADEGGWHDETGCLLLLAAIGGAAWAYSEENPAGYLAATLATAFALTTWLAGARQGRERQRLREAALEYVRTLTAAQSTGTPVPELSAPLRGLLEEEAARERG